MTLQESYERLDGNYDQAKMQLMNDRLVERFMLKFPGDNSIEILRNAIAEGNIAESFRGAHTLKGVAANLAFTGLYQAACELTEQLRPKTEPADPVLYQKVEEKYRQVIDTIEEYKKEKEA